MASFPSYSVAEISSLELESLLDDDEASFRLIDVREEDEYAICRIQSAELTPLSTFGELDLAVFGEDKEAPVVFYCHHGMRSMQATSFLRQKGYVNVWSLAGGIDLWSQEIDSTVPRY